MLAESKLMTSPTPNSMPSADQAPALFDENVFRTELTALIPHLRAFSRSLCDNPALADDVAQDAMLKAWNAREKFKPGTNLKAWAFTMKRLARFAAWQLERLRVVLVAPENHSKTLWLKATSTIVMTELGLCKPWMLS